MLEWWPRLAHAWYLVVLIMAACKPAILAQLLPKKGWQSCLKIWGSNDFNGGKYCHILKHLSNFITTCGWIQVKQVNTE